MKTIFVMVEILLLVGIVSAGGTSYVYANGQRVAKINESGVFYIHSDNLGSTSVMTDSEGNVVEEQKNLPFGESIEGNEKYSFTGKELDETEVQYFGMRYYNPVTGRFLTIDPAAHGVSWYSYANNNPLKYIDPDGMKPKLLALTKQEKGIRDEVIGYMGEFKPMKQVMGIYKKIDGFFSTSASRLGDEVYKFTKDRTLADKYEDRIKKLAGDHTALIYSKGDKITRVLYLIYWDGMHEMVIPHEIIHRSHQVMFLSINNPDGLFLGDKNKEEGLTCFQNIPFIEYVLGKLRNERKKVDKIGNIKMATQFAMISRRITNIKQELKEEGEYMQEKLLKVKPPVTLDDFIQQVNTMHPGFHKGNEELLNGFYQRWKGIWDKAHPKK